VIADRDRAKPGFSGVFVMPNSPSRRPPDLRHGYLLNTLPLLVERRVLAWHRGARGHQETP
jgi:hypothetical protein